MVNFTAVVAILLGRATEIGPTLSNLLLLPV
jgi:hypothetical protein